MEGRVSIGSRAKVSGHFGTGLGCRVSGHFSAGPRGRVSGQFVAARWKAWGIRTVGWCFKKNVGLRINFSAQHKGPTESHRKYYGRSGGDSPHGLVVMVTTRCKGKGWW